LLPAVEKIEIIFVAQAPDWNADQSAALTVRIINIEAALTKLVSAYNQKKGGLVLRVDVLKKKFTDLNITLADVGGLLPIVEDMKQKLDAFERK